MEHNELLTIAKRSLWGLAIGDAFGETFFGKEDVILNRIRNRILKEGQWLFTDDTVMSIGTYNVLEHKGEIDQDILAKEFADNYLLDDYRGYGGTAHSILRNIASGQSWKQVSSAVFDGMGSMGNGAAMRSGPIGAYFHEDIGKLVHQAHLAAETTHANPEAIAGAIAVALAACIACRQGLKGDPLPAEEFFNFILEYVPVSDVKAKINKAATLPVSYDIRTVVSVLGNGTKLTAQDTVPFALWCAAHYSDNYENAIWTAVSGLGDRDTNCAIVGSIVVLSAPADTVPIQWNNQTEDFENSVFRK